MCFTFLPDQIKLITRDLAYGGAVEEFVVSLLLCIYVLFVFSPYFHQYISSKLSFLNKDVPDFLLSNTSCFGFTISNKFYNNEICYRQIKITDLQDIIL